MSGSRGTDRSAGDDPPEATDAGSDQWVVPYLDVALDARRRRRLVLGIGAGSFLAGTLVVAVPSVPVPSGSATGALARGLALLTAVAALLVATRRTLTTDDDTAWTPPQPPERGGEYSWGIVGSDIDEPLATLADSDVRDTARQPKQSRVRRRIRERAVAVLRAEGLAPEAVNRALSSGAWTDDPRAAAFLGSDVTLPVRTRIRDWASGDAFGRRARAAVDAIMARAAARDDRQAGTASRDSSPAHRRREAEPIDFASLARRIDVADRDDEPSRGRSGRADRSTASPSRSASPSPPDDAPATAVPGRQSDGEGPDR